VADEEMWIIPSLNSSSIVNTDDEETALLNWIIANRVKKS
jgi:hypothetical protein